ncbi:MAG: hypothetical protein KAH07_07325 [Flavobacteriaceae bacterium]|nr:hypothetical protein [Flavobacteriaceae bacterium]
MHKKLEAKIVNLAHSILQMKNRDDIEALKEKARVLYERLSVLAFLDEYLEANPNTSESKEAIIAKIEGVIANKEAVIEDSTLEKSENHKMFLEKISISKEPVFEAVKEEKVIVENIEEVEEEVEEEIEVEKNTDKEQIQQEEGAIGFEELIVKKVVEETTIEEEFKDSVSAEVTTNLFTKVETKKIIEKTSLNDKLQSNLQIGLNDRIAFVKHLFNESQDDFNRVISQLNSFKTEKEALTFVRKMVKPDYDWTNKEDLEERFLGLIVRKFL